MNRISCNCSTEKLGSSKKILMWRGLQGWIPHVWSAKAKRGWWRRGCEKGWMCGIMQKVPLGQTNTTLVLEHGTYWVNALWLQKIPSRASPMDCVWNTGRMSKVKVKWTKLRSNEQSQDQMNKVKKLSPFYLARSTMKVDPQLADKSQSWLILMCLFGLQA